jgi:DUF1365 family protein
LYRLPTPPAGGWLAIPRPMAQAEFYRGVVSHKRWGPVPHGFAYELYMVLVDADAPQASLSGLWPYASGASRWALSTFREEDHMKGFPRAHAGETLGACVRRALCQLVPGYAPSAGSRLLLLTHLCNFGYAFNPISLYYVVAREGGVECMLAEVSNTPWNEMHLYPLHARAPGVRAGLEAPGGGSRAAAPPPPLPPLPLSAPAQRQLLGGGAVPPLDFEGLAARFAAPGGQAAAADGSAKKRRGSVPSEAAAAGAAAPAGDAQGAALQAGAPHLRFTWAKDFHVSPFFGMDHMCVQRAPLVLAGPPKRPALPHCTPSPHARPASYDCRFSQPNGHTLLVQSANWKGGERVFTTQLMLERVALTRASLAYMLFWAFPLLTFRIQWWIHYEAFRLWGKGVGLFPHPTGARNAFVDTVEALVLALMATGRLLSCCCRGKQAAGGRGHG